MICLVDKYPLDAGFYLFDDLHDTALVVFRETPKVYGSVRLAWEPCHLLIWYTRSHCPINLKFMKMTAYSSISSPYAEGWFSLFLLFRQQKQPCAVESLSFTLRWSNRVVENAVCGNSGLMIISSFFPTATLIFVSAIQSIGSA